MSSTPTTGTSLPTTWQDGKMTALERRCLLPLSSQSHKGSSGRVGVLGGSADYTGAPFYAGMASLHAGADLAYIFTAQEAALPIKCYSPELMVTPVYRAADFDQVAKSDDDYDDNDDTKNSTASAEADRLVEDMVQSVVSKLDRLHVLIVGPGLGRCPLVFRAVARIIQHARQRKLPLVLDADALYFLSLPDYQSTVQGYEQIVLTPNLVEYQRLLQANGSLPSALAAATIVVKGQVDRIQRGGKEIYQCEEPGGWKRSGGIGDVLAGTMGTMAAWNGILTQKQQEQTGDLLSPSSSSYSSPDLALSVWMACCFVKRATRRAFERKKRAMTAPDVLAELGSVMNNMTTI